MRYTGRQFDVWKPIITAVNGRCFGGGLWFLGDCDLALAAEHATFSNPATSLGMVVASGSVALARRASFSAILRMAVLGRHDALSAADTLAAGMVTDVVPADRLLDSRARVRGAHRPQLSPCGRADAARAVGRAVASTRRRAPTRGRGPSRLARAPRRDRGSARLRGTARTRLGAAVSERAARRREGPRRHSDGVGTARVPVPRRARCRRRARRSAGRRPHVAHATVRRPRRRPSRSPSARRHPARAAATWPRQAQRRDRREAPARPRAVPRSRGLGRRARRELPARRHGRPRSARATSSSTRNDRLVHCSITGYGHDGPYRDRPAMDLVVQAMSGFMAKTGFPDGPPVKSGVMIGDELPAVFAALGVLAALRVRDRDGRGRFVDLSMFDALLTLLWDEPDRPLRGHRPRRAIRQHRSARRAGRCVSRPPTATSRWCSRATTSGRRCAR